VDTDFFEKVFVASKVQADGVFAYADFSCDIVNGCIVIAFLGEK
jgi:hypothetical protein